MNIVIDYPTWYLLLCLTLGVVYSIILYYRDARLGDFPLYLKRLLAIFRGVTVFVLALLLLNPLLKSVERNIEKPIIVIAQDNSESVGLGLDSNYFSETYLKNLESLKRSLGNDFEIQSYTFGEKVRLNEEIDFKEKRTSVSELFEEINTRYYSRNLGAVIVATDGIVNRGLNPLYLSDKLNAPIYAIALGDTAVKKDLILSNVAHNRIAYLGNKFPLEILVNANKLKGEYSQLRIYSKGKLLLDKKLDIDVDNYLTSFNEQIEATEVGIQRITVELTKIEGEETISNNRTDIFIDVLDSRQKILILAKSPHPDVAALKGAIESNKNYKVDAFSIDDFKGNLEEYNLMILHQLPSTKNNLKVLLNQAKKLNLPLMYILGSGTDYRNFNALKTGIRIDNYRGRMDEVTGGFDESFTYFTLDEKFKSNLNKFPPLNVPFGSFRMNKSVVPLFLQRVGNINTSKPLFAFNKVGNKKVGIICGEGIFRWKYFSFIENGSNKAFNELVTKTVQYLSLKEDRSRFRVSSDNDFPENQNIVFKAELYNESYELVNSSAVKMIITSEDDKQYEMEFSTTSDAYRLDAGILPVGNYAYLSSVSYDGKEYTEKGDFSVSEIIVERSNVVANHHLLFNLTEKSSGKMIYPDDMLEIAELIKSKEDIVPVSYTRDDLSEILNHWWIFFLMFTLLSVEWFLRKRGGAY